MNYAVPQGSAPTVYTKNYNTFKGVDFSTDPANISPSRSPDALNLISDAGGYPEKRLGWRTLTTFTAKINGIHRLYKDSTEYIIVHSGTTLYRWTSTADPVSLYTGAANNKSFSFCMNEKLWILTGTEYLVYDGTTMQPVSEIAYAPTTRIGVPPAGGGTALEAVNLLSPYRINTFLADGTSTSYTLDSTGIDSVTAVTVNGTATTAYTVNTTTGVVTFTTAPAAPTVSGQDNVSIKFKVIVSGYAEAISKCRFASRYGFGGDEGERVFFSGNATKPNVDWHCEIHSPDYLPDPAYIPDTSFAYVGSDANAIMGYRRLGSYLAIVKGDNSQDATIFLRSSSLDSNNAAAFPLTQGVVGIGAISMWSFANLGDEPLFLGSSGIYGIYTSDVTAMQSVQNRSYYVDARLASEANLNDACAVLWNGRYLLCVNSHVYVLDGKQSKTYIPQSGGNYLYECYYWDNVPATCFLEINGDLYFGTAEGKLCRFNNDVVRMTRYSDDGAAIHARWETKLDDDGNFALWKCVPLRGLYVMIKPDIRGSANVIVETDKQTSVMDEQIKVNRLTFTDLSFADFSFNTSRTPKVFPFNQKIHRYKHMRVICENNVVNQGFGIYGIVKNFTKNRAVR